MHPFSKLLGIDPRIMQRADEGIGGAIEAEMMKRKSIGTDKLMKPPAQAIRGAANTLFEYDGTIYDLTRLDINETTPVDVIKAKHQLEINTPRGEDRRINEFGMANIDPEAAMAAYGFDINRDRRRAMFRDRWGMNNKYINEGGEYGFGGRV